MFELIEDRKRPQIRWWTIPCAAAMIFCLGADIGVLIGRRVTDPTEWLQAAFLVGMTIWLVWPVAYQLSDRAQEQRKTDAL